jgi:hypothetical protein
MPDDLSTETSDYDELDDDDGDFTPSASAAAASTSTAKGKGKKATQGEFRIRGALNQFRPANLPVGALVRACLGACPRCTVLNPRRRHPERGDRPQPGIPARCVCNCSREHAVQWCIDVVWVENKQIGLIDSIFRNFYVPPIIFGMS